MVMVHVLHLIGIPGSFELLAWYMFFGILAVLVYRFLAGGEASLLGDSFGRRNVYLLLAFGPLGLLVALYSILYQDKPE